MKCYIFAFLFLLIGFTSSQARDITLEWTENTEPNLSGYKLHYNTVKSGPPYPTIVDVGNVLEYTFVDLDIKTYYWFVASSYSEEGWESGFSNEVTTNPPAPTGVRIK